MTYPTSSSASDVWSLRDVYKAEAGDDWPVAVETDPNFANVSLLINADGLADGSTSVVDASNNSLSIAAQGDAQVDTTIFKYGTGSMQFDGSGDRFQIANNSLLDLGTGQFTVEFWVRSNVSWTSYSVEYAHLVGKGSGTTTGSWALSAFNGNIWFRIPGGSAVQGSTTLSANTWHHLAATRDASNVVRVFVDGVLDGSGTNSTNGTSSESFNIGDRRIGDPSANYPFNGYIDDVRITKGVARYTANFTPPTNTFPTS